MAVSALEPKFWLGFVTMLGAEELDRAAFAMGDEGEVVVARVEEILAEHPREHWLSMAEGRGLPVSAVHSVDSAQKEALFESAGLLEELPSSGGGVRKGVGPWLPDVGRTPGRSAPALGEHTEAVLGDVR